MRRTSISLAVFLCCSTVEAVRLRVVVEWNNNSPLSLAVNDENVPSFWAASHKTPTCEQRTSNIPNSSITSSPQVGYGPIEFIIDPLPPDPSYRFSSAVAYCPNDQIFTAPPPTTATIRVFENEIEIFSDSILVKNDQYGEPQTYGTYKNLYKYSAGSWIDFDLLSYAPDDWRKMLVANYRTDFPLPGYPSIFQETTLPSERPKFVISGYIINKFGPVASANFHARVLDPPDESDYVTLNGQATADDNNDAEKRGTLVDTVTNNSGVNGNILVAQTDAAGRFILHLRGTRRYGGDNYQIEGSVDPLFSCAPNCLRTGVITAWKRAYIEQTFMFKRGAFLTSAQNSKKQISVDRTNELCANCWVRLIHSPRGTAGQGTTTFYYEDAKITKIANGVVTLDRTLTKSFKNAPSGTPVYLGDAMGIIDPTQYPNGDFYFAPNIGFLNQVYPASSVEYVFVPSHTQPLQYLPHVIKVADGLTWPADEVYVNEFGGRWFANLGRDNHQHLIGADRYRVIPNTQEAFGVTQTGNDVSQSYIFMSRIAGSFGMSTADWRLAGEIVVHELTHQWHTNEDLEMTGGYKEHCDSLSARFFNNPQRTCTQHSDLSKNVFGPCGGVCPEYSDGVVGFHYIPASRHSEYLWIRKRPEPIPRQDQVPN